MRLLLSALLLTAATPAFAGGFYLQEQSPLAVGRAFAGEAAIADSAATIFYNPAGMTNLPGTQVEAGAQFLLIDSHQRDLGSTRSVPGSATRFPTGGGNGGNPFDQPVFIPSGYISHHVANSPIWLGLGISAPFGLKVVYDDGWFGRYDSLRSDLKTYNFQPSVAVKFGNISVGGGVDIQSMTATLTAALPNVSPLLPDGNINIHGKDLAFGWNLGVQGEFGPLRLGAHYRSHIDHDLSGLVKITGLVGPLAGANSTRFGFAPISVPDIYSVGGVYSFGKARLLAGGEFTKWSRFNAITVENQGTVFLSSAQNYRDTWTGNVGVEYDLSPRLTLRAGSLYDQTPTRDGFRTTRVPDGNRVWATAGATAHVTQAIAVNLSYAHIWVDREPINRTDPLFAGTPAVTTVNTLSENTGHANELAASVSLKF